MPWLKVDDKLHDHRKARKAGKAAMGLWVLAGSWSAANLTDGFIPADLLPRWGTRTDAKRLVDAGLWHPDEQDGERGWRFHDWLDHQPDARSVKLKSEAESKGGSFGNHVRWHVRRDVIDPECEHCTTPGDRVPDQDPDRVKGSPPNPPARPGPARPHAAAAASTPMAAAAAPEQTPTTADVAVEILADKLRRYTALATLRTDKLTPDQADEITALIALHGDQALVDRALQGLRRDDPPRTIQAFLGGWRVMPPPGTGRLAVVPDPQCPTPGHSGTTRHCIQCAADRLAGEAR